MKRSKTLLWLFLLPLLVPMLVWGLQHWQSKQISNYTVGGFKNSKVGERAALNKLCNLIHNGRAGGKVRVGWSVTILSPPSKRGTQLYSVELKRFSKELVRYAPSSYKYNPWQLTIEKYIGVEDDALCQVAAKSGLANDLIWHGASLSRKGLAKLDDHGNWNFQ